MAMPGSGEGWHAPSCRRCKKFRGLQVAWGLVTTLYCSISLLLFLHPMGLHHNPCPSSLLIFALYGITYHIFSLGEQITLFAVLVCNIELVAFQFFTLLSLS